MKHLPERMHVVTVKFAIVLDNDIESPVRIETELDNLVKALDIAFNGTEGDGPAADYYMPAGSFQIVEVGPEEDWLDATELLGPSPEIPGWPVSS